MLNETSSTEIIVSNSGQIGNTAAAQYDPEALSEHWLTFYDAQAAVNDVMAHVSSLRGQKRRERHTERAYKDGLRYFLRWLGASVNRELRLKPGWFRMPSRTSMKQFIAHLYSERGLAASTVNAKYLAPVRHFIRGLEAQTPMPRNAGDMMLIGMLQQEYRQATAVKGPDRDETSNIGALWREGTRLSQNQINAVMRSFDRERLDDVRDEALLTVAFYTALRRAELAQITLNTIKNEGDVYSVTVLGKRSNVDPVTLPVAAYDAIMRWVNAYNDGLDQDDPRRIAGDVPVWQSLRRGGNRREMGDYQFKPSRGMTAGSIGEIIKRRVEGVLPGVDFSAHDTRRTALAVAYRQGALINQLQKIARHKDAAVTLAYVGEPPEFGDTDLSKFFALG